MAIEEYCRPRSIKRCVSAPTSRLECPDSQAPVGHRGGTKRNTHL
jgi:hypothetical protein